MNLAEIVLLVKNRRRQILMSAIVAALVFFALGQFLVEYNARASVVIRPYGQIDSDTLKNPVVGLVYSPKIDLLQNQGQSYVQLLKSYQLMRKVIQKLYSDTPPPEPNSLLELIKLPFRILVFGRAPTEQDPLERAVQKAMKRVNVVFVGASSVIEVTTRDSNPQWATDLANGLLQAMIEYSAAHRGEAIDRNSGLVALELESCQQDIRDKRKQLHEMSRQYDLAVYADFDAERTRANKKLIKLEDELERLQSEEPLLKEKLELVNAKLSEQPEYHRVSFAMRGNKQIGALKTKLLELELELQRTLLDSSADSSNVKSIEENIRLTKASLKKEANIILDQETQQLTPKYKELLNEKAQVETQLDSLPAMEREASARISQYRERLNLLESVSVKFNTLISRISNLQAYEIELIKMQRRLSAMKKMEIPEVEILDRAVVPRYPMIRHAPIMFFALLGFFLGALLSMGYFVMREEMDVAANPNKS